MDFFKKKEEKSRVEQFEEKRNNIKTQLSTKLYAIGFTDDEVEEVLNVIESAESDIARIKQSLIGTNINPDLSKDPNEPLYNGVMEIRKIQAQMEKELNETIARIKQSHQNSN